MSRRPQIHLPSYKSVRSTISAILLAGLLVALCPATSLAADWYVDDDGDPVLGDGSAANPFARVQDAIRAALDGDTILIAPGWYGEVIRIGKDLSLIGTAQDPSLTTLGSFLGNAFVVTVTNGAVVDLTGITVTGVYAQQGVRVEASATATMTRCVITECRIKWGDGGGIYNLGTMTLIGCDVSSNEAGPLLFLPGQPDPLGTGGGIFNWGTMTIVDTVISGNFAAEAGGGIANAGAMTLDGVSVLGNGCGHPPLSIGSWGGGIANGGQNAFNPFPSGTLRVSHSTIAHNYSAFGDGGGLSSEGAGADTTLDHTVLASNSGGGDGLGAVTSLGHNVVGDTTYLSILGDGTGDLYDIDAQVQGDGSLLASSPCIDAGDPALTPAGLDLAGNPRLLDGDLDGQMVLDIGAHEFSNVQLGIDGDATPGGTLNFEVSGTPGLPTLLLFSAGPGELMVSPYGTLLVGADFGRIPFVPAPATIAVLVPFGTPVGLSLVLQLVAIGPIAGTGNLSNAVTVTIE